MFLRISAQKPTGIRAGRLSTVHHPISATYATAHEPVPTGKVVK
ncbi:hypothetical protein FOPG_19822 [Fusarium oxysporum f. sp. conglutinans race 2 54008]|uniref:Uncharacterized protein n=1 Tax=Fusarium oxysporum f. sp. conglutinans race 2 54008 TaxID=1089457 RepID=X0GVG5_FUSOX|nr:hypothetical protein FOPG_19822 [Fusarium oxysporum f. sp. conglutinans race 2 54008]